MNAPVASDVRGWSKVNFADPTVGYPAPSSGPDKLDFVVSQACAYITHVTTRLLDSTMPASLVPLAQQAVLRRTEQLVMQGRADEVDTVSELDRIASFTAGSYSETRVAPDKQKALNPDPQLSDLLWLMLSDAVEELGAANADGSDGNEKVAARRDYWRWMLGYAPNLPAWQLVEADWARQGEMMINTISPYEQWSRYV